MAQSDGETEPTFAFFSMTGERFEAPGMPADTAREVGYYRDAVYELARSVWLERNPDRRKVPDGFDAAFDLRLTTVEQGSARPQLLLHRPNGVSDPDWDEWAEIYEVARDRLTATASKASKDLAVPDDVPKRVVTSLHKVGATLRGSESIQFGHPKDDDRRAQITEQVRRVIRSIDETLVAAPTPTQMALEGVITEYDGVGRSFQLRTASGVSTCVIEDLNPELGERVRAVLALDGVTAPDVSVEGETLDPQRRTVQLFNVHRVTIVRSVGQKFMAMKLAQLAGLEDGWWGPGSVAPSTAVLERLDLALEQLSALGLPVELVPVGDGSVVVELRRGDVELSATLDGEGGMALVRDNTETDELAEAETSWDPARLISFLTRGDI